VLQAIRSEVATIMDPSGVTFDWLNLSGTSGSEVSAELVVITFKGKCEFRPAIQTRTEPAALGWTHISDGEVLPFGDIHCDRVQQLLYPFLLAMDGSDRDYAFGRAVGRVLAHELYHILAKTTHHASGGVAKPCYNASELMSSKFRFRERDSQLIRGKRVREQLPMNTFLGGQ
jgi:hypothetical protein